ncbi:SGNH/GDSL hydrolase family protein [Microbacterium sp. BK668]|uniref:SGNH/GDSL hydrolase family protein n=1 Tax=Microbacterium sp. BK668 TaxID=2512118 RepID=UPI00105DEDFB|nr:SGNH/GDSL hydrolase family protein [Microbacterium sp. BK668]TDN91841.1 GDSL-like lipase/acylhydrolase family protein [Microbacterium sp. BK668]
MRVSKAGRRALAAVLAGVIAVGSLFASSAASAAPALPARMAALGDSISQAAMTCSALLSCPANSWSTGTTTSVVSHAARLRAAGATSLVAYNDAVSSSLSSALATQASRAVSQGAQYVTIEIGANDACTKTVAGMTSVATFTANVQAGLSTLAAGANQPEIFVASIPNLLRMYELNKGSFTARLTWASLGICQSLLANPSSTNAADVNRRNAVQQRVNEFNAALAAVCAATAKCRFDNYAVANYAFTKADISTRDYFHPSITGQARLAAITWPTTQWAS